MMMHKVLAAVFGIALALELALPEGSSSCDMAIWYTENGLQYCCPSQQCALCGLSGPTHSVTGWCSMVDPGHWTGNPARVCRCTSNTDSSGDTCYAVVVFHPRQGTTWDCEQNAREDCQCPGIGFPQPTCKHVADFPLTPLQVCQCVAGEEEWGN